MKLKQGKAVQLDKFMYIKQKNKCASVTGIKLLNSIEKFIRDSNTKKKTWAKYLHFSITSYEQN